MTTYDWPSIETLRLGRHELKVIDNLQRMHESPLSGAIQTQSLPGARWGYDITIPAHYTDLRRQVEAMLIRLSGRQHRLRLWDIKNPVPAGNIALTGVTLGAAAAQFATALQLAGCWPANNRLRYSRAFDNAAWSKAGATVVADVAAAPDGTTTADRIVPSTSVESHTLTQVAAAVTAGDVITFSCYAYNDGAPAFVLQFVSATGAFNGYQTDVRVDLSTGGFLTHAGTAIARQCAAVPGWPGWYRVSMTVQAPLSGAVSCRLFSAVSTSNFTLAGDGTAGTRVSGAQLEVAAEPSAQADVATLKAGDWLGLPGGQLVRVVEDAAANNTGAMTVEVRHMLRSALASGGAVTLNKPMGTYVLTDSGLALPRSAVPWDPEFTFSLVEVWP